MDLNRTEHHEINAEWINDETRIDYEWTATKGNKNAKIMGVKWSENKWDKSD